MFEEMMRAALNCPKTHSLKVGDKVKILGRDYEDNTGTIIREEVNGLNLPLVILDMLTEETRETRRSYELSFYPHEVEKIDD